MPALPPLDSAFNGAHYAHIRDALPDWLTQATPERLGALKGASLNVVTTPAALMAAIAEHWHRQTGEPAHFQAGKN
jgi:hypothetical protein